MRFFTFGLLFVTLFGSSAWSQELLCENERILPVGLAVDDQFGYSVAVDGDTLATTAINQGGGSVWIYVHGSSGWTLQQKLDAPSYSNWFGFSLSLEGDRLAIGRPKLNLGVGGVDLFTRSAGVWTLEQTIDGLGGYFGASLDLENDRLLVGAPLADHFSDGGGAAYIYKLAGTWQLEQQLNPSTVLADSGLGTSVALDGELAVVSGPGKSWVAHAPRGKAHVYRRVGALWQLEATLRNPAGSSTHSFGISVTAEGGLVAVGETGNASGVVHLFRKQAAGWRYEAQIEPPVAGPGLQFGSRLALHNGELFVGPRYAKTAFLYGEGSQGWTQLAQLVPALEASTQYEQSLAIGDNWIVVGNRYEPEGAHQGGAIRIYARPLTPLADILCAGDTGLCPCGNESPANSLMGCMHSAGLGAQIAAAGTASLSGNDMRLFGRALPMGTPAFLFASSSASAPTPAGDGLSCLGGSTARLGMRQWGDHVWGPGLLGSCGAGSGETWVWQVALRDAAGPCGAGFTWSQALRVSVLP